MGRLISALTGSALLVATGVFVLPVQPTMAAIARQDTGWGLLSELVGSEWRSERTGALYRFEWREPDRVLVWRVGQTPETMRDEVIFTRDPATGVIQGVMPNFFNRRGPIEVASDGGVLFSVGGLVPIRTEFRREGSGYQMNAGGLGASTQTALIRVSGPPSEVATDTPPRRPSAPIIIAAAPEPLPAGRSGRNARSAARAETPAPRAPVVAPEASPQAATSRPGPIIIASAPPPPATTRPGPRGSATPPPRSTTDSREAAMQAQVVSRRVEAAREAEAERQRQAQIAEQARYAEETRRAQEAANSAAWGEAFGLLGAIVGGVAAGASSNGDMTAITAGMAAGSSLAAPNSEITTAANQNFEAERARYEAEQAAERELHARTMAAMNDPNNPLTQQQRRAEATRVERAEAERTGMERRHREEREAEEREALETQRNSEREADQSQAREDQERAEQEQREAAAAGQRQRDAERRRQEEEETRAAAERGRQVRAETQRREQEARQQEEERRRADRARMMRTGNASGGYSLSGGLPPLAPASRGPGSGTTTVPMDHIGGCRASGATVRYNLGVLMGEAVVGGGLAWSGEEGCSLPASTNAWVKVSWNGSYAWVSLGASPGSANGGPGYNSPGSPSWGALLCGFEGGRPTSCMDSDSAKRLWTNGTVTEVTIGW